MGIKSLNLKGFNLAAAKPNAKQPKPAFTPLASKPLQSKPLASKPLTVAKPTAARPQVAARKPTAFAEASAKSTFTTATKSESKLAQFARELKAARAPAPADPNAPKIVID